MHTAADLLKLSSLICCLQMLLHMYPVPVQQAGLPLPSLREEALSRR